MSIDSYVDFLRERIIFDGHIRLFFQSHKNRGGPVVGGKDSDGPRLDSHGSIPNNVLFYFFQLACEGILLSPRYRSFIFFHLLTLLFLLN